MMQEKHKKYLDKIRGLYSKLDSTRWWLRACYENKVISSNGDAELLQVLYDYAVFIYKQELSLESSLINEMASFLDTLIELKKELDELSPPKKPNSCLLTV